jgi:predicted nucleotidyltransferase
MQNNYRPLFEVESHDPVSREYRYVQGMPINKTLERVRSMMHREAEFVEDRSRICDPSNLIIQIKSYNSVPRSSFTTILTYLRRLEIEQDIIIHNAVEIGSRAYNLHNPYSDYDLRFVFSHRERVYASEQIREYGHKSNSLCGDMIDNGIHIDYQGWQLEKFMSLLKKNNVMAIEVLESPIVYLDRSDFRSKFGRVLNLMPSQKVSRTMYHHYLKMARTNFDNLKRFIEKSSGDNDNPNPREVCSGSISDETQPLLSKYTIVRYKKYLTIIRPILQSIYIVLSRCESGLSEGLEDLLPRMIFNFDELLQYYENRVGIHFDPTYDGSSDESDDCAELDVTTDSASYDIVDEACYCEIDRSIKLNGSSSDSDSDSDSNDTYAYLSELMMDEGAWTSLQRVVALKRESSESLGPVMYNLHTWIEQCLLELSDPTSFSHKLRRTEKKVNVDSLLRDTYKSFIYQ